MQCSAKDSDGQLPPSAPESDIAFPSDKKDGLMHSKSHTTDVNMSSNLEISESHVFSGVNGENYQTMGRWHALFALTTNQFGLGILSLPANLKILGLIPGIIAIFGIGGITWYTGYVLYEFFCTHPQVASIVDMVGIVGGPWWECLAGVFLVLQCVLTAAAAVVTLSVAFNTISGHGMCTIGFIGISCLICFLLCIPRAVKFLAKSGIICLISIGVASLLVMIALGVGDPPQAPSGWTPQITLVGNPSFREGFNACLRISLAYAGNITFPSFMAEMRNAKRDFPFSLAWLFIVSALVYTTVGVTVYCLAGEFTVSPALGSAPVVAAKAAYGLMLPAVFTTGLAGGHVGTKYIYLFVMQRIGAIDLVTSNTAKPWAIWLSLVTTFWIVSFCLANAIPIFDSILSICSASTFAWFCYGLPGILWFNLNKGRYLDGWKQKGLIVVNVLMIIMAFFMNGAGLWTSITELMDIFATGVGIKGAFDCGDNSII